MSSTRDREREREKMEKDRDKERPGKERANSPTNKRVKAGDRPHHPLRDSGSDPKAKSGGGDDKGRDDERRGSDEGKNKREDRLKGGYDRTRSGDDLRGERKEERSSKPSNGGERAKGGVDDRSRYNSVGKGWKEKGEKEDYGSSGVQAIPTRGGDVISALPPSAGSSKYDPEKRRSMVAADLPSSVKRDLAAGSKTETALERIVKDISTQKHARPGSAHYVSTSTNNNFASDANDMKLREVSANEPTTGEDESSRRLVWRKNHSGGAPPVGGSLIVRPSDPMNREPYAKEWRKSREVAQSSMARDMTAREPTTTTAAREPPIPGIGGPAMPSSVKPGAKYDLLAPMRESIALRAKAEGDLASQQKILTEVKELRAKVKQLEKALKQERDEARRYKSQLDLLRGDMEDALAKAAARAREENGKTATEQKLPKQRFSVEVEGEQHRRHSRERPALAPLVPSDPAENHQNSAPVRPLSHSASVISTIPTTSTPAPPVPTPTPLSASSSSAPTPSVASHAPEEKPTTRRVSQGPTASAVSHAPEENTTAGAPHAHFKKPTASTTSHTHAERPSSASYGKPAAAPDQTSQTTPSTPFGNTPATKGLNCFTAKRYWPKEKEKESLAVVFHTAGIRVVKPFTEEVVEDLKWEQVLRWSVNEDEQSFRFFVESRSTSALINHTYETDEVKEISHLVAQLTDRESGDEGGKQSSDSIASTSSNNSGSTPAVSEKRNSFENESLPVVKKASLLKKFSSFHRRKRSVIINDH